MNATRKCENRQTSENPLLTKFIVAIVKNEEPFTAWSTSFSLTFSLVAISISNPQKASVKKVDDFEIEFLGYLWCFATLSRKWQKDYLSLFRDFFCSKNQWILKQLKETLSISCILWFSFPFIFKLTSILAAINYQFFWPLKEEFRLISLGGDAKRI